VIYLTRAEILHVAERTLGPALVVRDHGLLESAVARPATTVFGRDAYPTLDDKAAALLHSLARNYSLVDGNQPLALAATIAFYGVNGRRLGLTNDEAYDLIGQVSSGQLDAVDPIAAILRDGTEPWETSRAASAGRRRAEASRDTASRFRRFEGAA
jgi:death-on-curing protein